MYFCLCTATREPEGGTDAIAKQASSLREGKACFSAILDGKQPQCGVCYAHFMKSVKANLEAQEVSEGAEAAAPTQNRGARYSCGSQNNQGTNAPSHYEGQFAQPA